MIQENSFFVYTCTYVDKENDKFHETPLDHVENGRLHIGFYLIRPRKSFCDECKTYEY